MMNVKILGGGCAKCNQLEKNAVSALNDLHIPYELEHVTDFAKIAAYGVMSTPALMLNDQIAAMGTVLTIADIKALLTK